MKQRRATELIKAFRGYRWLDYSEYVLLGEDIDYPEDNSDSDRELFQEMYRAFVVPTTVYNMQVLGDESNWFRCFYTNEDGDIIANYFIDDDEFNEVIG